MSGFEKQNEMANDILTNYRGKVLAIVKATRAGATFSLLKRACELGQKTVIVAPYIKIFDNTVNDVVNFSPDNKPVYARIASNKEMCKKIQERIRQYSALQNFPFHIKPSCKTCEYNSPEECELQRVLTNDNWDILALTYAKLKHLCMSKSEIAKKFVEKISSADNLILDEFTTGVLVTAPYAEIEDPTHRLERDFHLSTRQIQGIAREIPFSEGMFWCGVGLFASEAEAFGSHLNPGEYSVYLNSVTEEDPTFFAEHANECWKILERLKIEGHETRLLQQILQVIGAKKFVIANSTKGHVTVQPIEDMSERSIRGYDFLKDFAKGFLSAGKVAALVDACLPDLNLDEILELPVEKFFWGDPLMTNKSQIVICHTRRFGEKEFFNEKNLQMQLKQLIRFVSDIHAPSAVLLVTLNKKMANVVKAWRSKKEISEEIEVTYYRSELSRGITIDKKHRVIVLMGGPYLPKLSYLAETYDTDLIGAFRISDMKSAFINLIGRVKHPKGEEKSVVYAAGITPREVRAFLKQEDVMPPLIFEFLTTGADSLDFLLAGNSFLHAEELAEKWDNLEEDLPILVKILRKVRYTDESHTLSEISSKHVKKLQSFVERYPEVLRQFKIEVSKEPRGYRLTPLRV